jgi:hypothetical protein
MAKNITVSYVDCCLSGYFNGSSKPVLQYPVDGATTRKQLYDGLLSELDIGVIDYQIEQNNLDYDDIRQAIKDRIFFNPECQDNDILFPCLEIWSEEEGIESCYAFFVVRWEEEEGSE